MNEATLLVKCLNMLRALQWAGYNYEPDWSDVTPGDGLTSNLCPVCANGETWSQGHEQDCKLSALIQEIIMAADAPGAAGGVDDDLQ